MGISVSEIAKTPTLNQTSPNTYLYQTQVKETENCSEKLDDLTWNPKGECVWHDGTTGFRFFYHS